MPDSRPLPPRPPVSVALASCDGERWIGTQIASILEQLGPGDELVVADASSRDGTLDVVRGFGDERIRILEGIPRGNIPGTFQAALRECRHDLVFFSDQDDLWLPGKVDHCAAALADSPHELLLHDARVVGSQGREIAPSFLEQVGFRPGFWSNLWRPGYLGCALCAKRSLLERALPFPPSVPMHDWWLGLLAERGGRVLVLREPWIDHRMHGSNASTAPRNSRYGLFHRLRMRTSILRSVLARSRGA
jgi:glycosyltransferase involved in cell wall biosynthesis